MAVSPNRRYVALAEKGEKAAVAVFDLQSLRKRKILSSPEVSDEDGQLRTTLCPRAPKVRRNRHGS